VIEQGSNMVGMFGVLTDPVYGEQGFAAELAGLDAAGLLVAAADREALDGPVEILEVDWFDDAPQRMSRVDALEWEVWAGVEQDEAERAMLAERAPGWVFLPPGGELAAALEGVRPLAESPIALSEVMKAAARLVAWAEAVKMSAMASFERQRQAEAADIPRPSGLAARGRPTDPERSRAAEVACALRLAPGTVRRHIDTALRLTGVLSATLAGLRCGALSLSKAIAICEATRELDPVQARAVEAHVLKRAAGQTQANLLRSLARQVAKYNTKDKAERHRDAVTKRECRIIPLADGMAGLWVTHTADKIQQMWIVIQAIADLDADVITIETSRSNMELLDAFVNFNYPNEIGPGVWDIHSPRVPSTEEMENLIRKAEAVIPMRDLWVNPDCGLKTRGWDEVKTSLRNMVDCAARLREEMSVKS